MVLELGRPALTRLSISRSFARSNACSLVRQGKVIQGAPECCSYTFNDELKVTSFTGGYVIARRVGNTGGMGALFGILHAIGAPVPRPGSLTWNVLGLINKLKNAIVGLVSMLPFMPKAKAT